MIEELESILMKAVIGVGIEDGVVCIVMHDGTEVYLEEVTHITVDHPERLQ